MPLRTESLDEPSLNLTPMIDIVFLLLIFFMVGTKFSEVEQQFDVELPTASPMQTMTRQPDPLTVTVSQTGSLALNGVPVDIGELKTQLMAAREAWADQPVLIRGDGQGEYQSVIDVMNLCQEVRISRFSLAFQPVEKANSP